MGIPYLAKPELTRPHGAVTLGFMNLANRITSFRILLAPVFLILFEIHSHFYFWPVLLILGIIFLISELTDVLDGVVARRMGITSEVGKLLDPFSDVLSRITIFLCLLIAGIAPWWAFAVILYREIGVTFLRMLMVMRGKVQGAKMAGKVKAWFYFVTSLCGLAQYAAKSLGLSSSILQVWQMITIFFFALSAFMAIYSFIPYWRAYRELNKKA